MIFWTGRNDMRHPEVLHTRRKPALKHGVYSAPGRRGQQDAESIPRSGKPSRLDCKLSVPGLSFRRRLLGSLIATGLLCTSLWGITLEELQNDAKLTPKRFASYFRDFEYCYREEVQPPEVFLATKSGDCDDYAILADQVLRPKGYDTRLIAVRMPGLVAHVICYVAQEKGYLDYNNRIYTLSLARSGSTTRQIADKVAASFNANWTTASEFTFDKDMNMKLIVATVVKTEPKALDPVPGAIKSAPKRHIIIDF